MDGAHIGAGTREQQPKSLVMALTREQLAFQTEHYRGTGGTSHDNREQGFVPAFQDAASGQVMVSTYADGRSATVHVLDGLPEEYVLKRDAQGRVVAVSDVIVPGFLRGGRFYTRQQAIEALHNEEAALGEQNS